MALKNILLIIQIIALAKIFLAYPSGAPLESCDSMLPDHGADPQSGPSPYNITIKPLKTSTSFNVTIAIKTQDKKFDFKGFLIECRSDWEGQVIGSWKTDVQHTKTLDCSDLQDSAVTHHWKDDINDDGGHFHNITVKWTPNSNLKISTVYFIATVVKSKKEIYMNVSNTYDLSAYLKF